MLSFSPSSFVRNLVPGAFPLRAAQPITTLLLTFATALSAQSIAFSGNQTVLANSFVTAQGTAVDSGGNIYVADAANHRVMKIAPNAAADCSTGCTQTGGSFTNPIGVAVDASGDIYVLDSGSRQLVKLNAAGQVILTIPGLPLQPVSVAVDTIGNSYVMVANSAGILLKYSPDGSPLPVAIPNLTATGMAVDANGNIYIASSDLSAVVKVPPAGGPGTTVVSGLSAISSIAVDGAGTLYLGDTANNRILMGPAGTTNLNCATGCTTLGAGLTNPAGLSVDASGNVYFANNSTNIVKLGADVDFGLANVAATTPASHTLLYQLSGSDCSAANTVSVLTRGSANKDFTASATGTCTPGSPTTFSVTINFTPKFSGVRTGSLQLIDAGGDVQATTYLHGIGKGPQLTWIPGVTSPVIGGGPPPPP
jgi:sugar lactone lactonase YvrE